MERSNVKSYKDETIEISIGRSEELASKFVEEVRRLLNSGAIDTESHNRGLLFGVALENMADDFLRGSKTTKDYKNLKRF